MLQKRPRYFQGSIYLDFLKLHFLLSLFVQCHSVRSNSLREQVPFSPALARFSSPLELFPDRRAAIAGMYVFICEAKLIACLPYGCPIFCANLLHCLWIYHASSPYSQNDTRTLSRPISQHPASNRHGGGCCEALGLTIKTTLSRMFKIQDRLLANVQDSRPPCREC